MSKASRQRQRVAAFRMPSNNSPSMVADPTDSRFVVVAHTVPSQVLGPLNFGVRMALDPTTAASPSRSRCR